MELTATFTNTSHDTQPPYEQDAAFALSRATIRRVYSGDMTGESVAEALVCQTAPTRMAYVGADRFVGMFRGRRGGFVFQHGGIIEKGTFTPFGYIVPGSGTGELAGIRGDCVIRVTPAGEHSVTFIYELPS